MTVQGECALGACVLGFERLAGHLQNEAEGTGSTALTVRGRVVVDDGLAGTVTTRLGT